MSIPIDDVLRALRTFERGATTRELAERLGMKPDSLGGRLSKTYLYGGPLDRENETVRTDNGKKGRFDRYIWRATV